MYGDMYHNTIQLLRSVLIMWWWYHTVTNQQRRQSVV